MDNKNDKKIFISHSEKNKDFVDILLKFLILLGVKEKEIFCSSNYKTGVENQIGPEVFSALKSTVIDIIVLSNDYKESSYCLNEAGIIGFKCNHNESKKLIVVLPGIIGTQSAGFITEDDHQCRLINDEFFDGFSSKLIGCLREENLLPDNEDHLDLTKKIIKKQIDAYKKQLPILENLKIESTENSKDSERSEIESARKKIMEMFQADISFKHKRPYVFYKDYARIILIKAAKPGKIIVETITQCVIVNLSSKDYLESYSIQFPQTDSSNTWGEEYIKVNGQELSARTWEERNHSLSNLQYVEYEAPSITIKGHSSAAIENKVSYEIIPSRFFQSKIIRIPSGSYTVQAAFDPSFTKIFGLDYQFKFQIIPPNSRHLNNGVVPREAHADGPCKCSVHYACQTGFPAGGGYVLTIQKYNSHYIIKK